MKKYISNIVTDRMQERNCTLYQLSKMTGVQITNLQRILAAEKNYTVDSLEKIANALDLQVVLWKK